MDRMASEERQTIVSRVRSNGICRWGKIENVKATYVMQLLNIIPTLIQTSLPKVVYIHVDQVQQQMCYFTAAALNTKHLPCVQEGYGLEMLHKLIPNSHYLNILTLAIVLYEGTENNIISCRGKGRLCQIDGDVWDGKKKRGVMCAQSDRLDMIVTEGVNARNLIMCSNQR